MESRLNYFIFNKKKDFERGYGEDVIWEGDRLRALAGADGEGGYFFTRLLDSRERRLEWHRLVYAPEKEREATVRVSVYASDTRELLPDRTSWEYKAGETRDLEVFLRDAQIPLKQKKERLHPFLKRQTEGQEDILLHGITGRYLWLLFELFHDGTEVEDAVCGGRKTEPGIQGIRVYFPKQSLMKYLPEVYQASDKEHFLERYLAIFQTLIEELNQEIRETPRLLDADTAEEWALPWLAGWLGIGGSYMWSQERLRKLLKEGAQLYKKRGTREGILSLLRLYTGHEAWLVEYHQLEPFLKDRAVKEELCRLYGRNPCRLTVLVEKEAVPTQKEYRALLRVLEEVTPVQMEMTLLALEPYLFLGAHTYLGLNSVLGEYRPPVLDSRTMIPFAALQEDTLS